MILAIDFDGTIAELAWPKVGALKKDADVYINMLYNEGHTIIINTCRTGKYEGMAQDFLKKHGIKYHYINSNDPELIKLYKQDCRKISADIYIDDKCLMGLPKTWNKIYKLIVEKIVENEEIKINKIMNSIYTDLYKNSTPSADFKKLMENAKLNEKGEKIIPFDEYEIDYDLFDSILNNHIEKTKFSLYIKNKIKTSIYLGCGPRYKKKREP